MSSSKREREAARRRHERWLEHQAAERARRRRRWTVLGTSLGLVLVAGAVALVVVLGGDDDLAAEPAPTTAASPAPSPTEAPVSGEHERPVPDPSVAEGRTWEATLATTAGELGLTLDGAAAPQAVASFVTLAREGFFDGTTCHRLTDTGIFVLQCGDPTGTGTGGPGYRFGPIENAPADDVYPAGTVAMARVSGDGSSMGSQFFLVYEDSTIPADAAGGYTVLGTVVTGMDVLADVAAAGIAEGTGSTPATEVTIEGVELQ
ncbi:peptidylprolyl isomerase [Cellulomonas sp. APG4]|uniref:peptidylprolyl isomerase n=1 Tax=Cellulomonas sp. APG4 TaxID=1538656 RepID=UPI00137ACC7B|nr:peptidylprolyl isomerase [Cellulomonas sp. APG4]